MSDAKATASTGRRQELEAAFRATHYTVETRAGQFTLRIGQHSPELARLYQLHACGNSAYLTACNPGSCPADESRNLAANAVLRQQLEAMGRPWFRGYAVDPEGKWPAEASFLALGLSAGEAAVLGRAHGQNAIVVIGSDAVPELLWLRAPDAWPARDVC